MIKRMPVGSRSVPLRIVAWLGAIALCVSLLAVDLSQAPHNQFTVRLAVSVMRVYQRDLHPFTSKLTRCRLEPTCSRFAIDALKSNGLPGVFQVGQRLVSCSRAQPQIRRASLASELPLAFLQATNPDQACGACLATTGGLILLIVGLIAASVALLVWVARDAKNRSVENPILWMLLVFFTSFLGLVIYLLVRPGGNLVSCDSCRNKKLQYARLCPHCGNTDSRAPVATPTGRLPANTTPPNIEVVNRPKVGTVLGLSPRELAAEAEVNRLRAEKGRSGSRADLGEPGHRTPPEIIVHPQQSEVSEKAPSPGVGLSATIPPMSQALFCGECGAKQEPDARFCDDCGAAL
jgi:putative component of membrane protein insertase Oxa1/YidC/SpoIIIJ protein YidD